MTIALIGIAAALALCVALLAAALAVRGRRARSAVARAEENARQTRLLAELASSLDLDEVLLRTLEAARALPTADAALLTLRGVDAKPIIAAVGLSPEEAARRAAELPEDARARAVGTAFAYRDDEDSAGSIQGALTVPVAEEDSGQLGVLSVFTRAHGQLFGDDAIGWLEEVAAHAAPAIENARRFREARQLADHDALTALHNRRYFHETLAREVARAQRYERRLALIVFDLDDFKDVNDRIGHLAGDAVLAELAERVREAVRSADVPCRVGGDEFAVILPESTLTDAEQLFARIQDAVAARPLAQAGRVVLSAGVTELRPDDDAIGFFQRADDALYRAKERGKGRAVAADGGA